jgi:hypothetical protein
MPIIIKKKAAPLEPAPIKAPERRQTKNPGRVLDGQCLACAELIGRPPVSWFLMASYLYYIHDLPLISDGLYDNLGRALLHDFDEIEHQHQALLTKEALRAGTMHHIRADQYPLMTRAAAARLADLEWGITVDTFKDCDDFERDG